MAATTPYDLVVRARRLTDVYDATKGWDVVVTPEALKELGKTKQTTRVSPIGHFNVGKTFIINKLSGAALPCGDEKHTEGLSLYATQGATVNQRIVFLDTAGLNSPVVQVSDAIAAAEEGEMMKAAVAVASPDAASIHTRKCIKALHEELREVKRLENFHREVAFEFADVFLFVVGQMSHQDQLDIMLLMRKLKQTGAQRKTIFVVHNLRTWNRKELETDKKADGNTYVSRIEKLFFMQEYKVTPTAVVDANGRLVLPGRGYTGQAEELKAEITTLSGTFGQNVEDGLTLTHLFLCDDAQERDYNAVVLSHLLAGLSTEMPMTRPTTALLEETLTRVQCGFSEVDKSAPPTLRILPRPAAAAAAATEESPQPDAAAAEDWPQPDAAAAANGARPPAPFAVYSVGATGEKATVKVNAQPLELQSYLTLGSDDLQYNIVRLQGVVPPARAGGLAQKKVLYGLQFVLPGLLPAEVQAVRSVARLSGPGAAFRLELSEGARVLTVDFASLERVLPDGHLRKAFEHMEAAQPGVVSVADTEAKVTEEGTRSYFGPSLQRPVPVQLRSGLANITPLVKPIVAYNDGVLSIVVASSDKFDKVFKEGPPKAAPAAASQ